MIRDELFNTLGWHGAGAEKAEEARLSRLDEAETYYEHLAGVEGDFERLDALREDIQVRIQEIQEDGGSRKQLPKLEAALAATEQKLTQMLQPEVELEHPTRYAFDLSQAAKALKERQANEKLKPKTIAKVDAALKRFTDYVGRVPKLNTISARKVAGYIDHQREAGSAKATVGNDLSFLGQAYRLAQVNGFVPERSTNPFNNHNLRGFKKAVTAQRFTGAQLAKVLEHVAEDRDLVVAILVGYYTGMRISEVFSARLDKSAETLIWRIAEEGGKTANATRYVPLHDQLQADLTAIKALPDVGNSINWNSPSDQAIGKRFGRAKETVLIAMNVPDRKGYNFHSLRHGFITMLTEAGVTELQIADLSGHAKGGGKTSVTTYVRPQDLETRKEIVGMIPVLSLPQALLSRLSPHTRPT